MRDADRLVAVGYPACGQQRLVHPERHLLVGLAPGRPERVVEPTPVGRPAQCTVADPEGQSFEVVLALDESFVDLHLQPELRRDRLGGLHRPLQRR